MGVWVSPSLKSIISRRRLLQGSLLLLVSLAFYLFRTNGDAREREIRATLEQLLADLRVRTDETPGPRDRRVQAAVDQYFTDPVTVRHADMPRTGAGRRALLLWARLLERFESAELSLAYLDVSVNDDQRAIAKADVKLDASDTEGSYAYQRQVELVLVRQGARWVIESLDVATAAAEQPEARP